MRPIVRLTILIVFSAAGAGIAILLAEHRATIFSMFDSPASQSIDEPEVIFSVPSFATSPAPIKLTSQTFADASPPPRQVPSSESDPPPLAGKIAQLEMKLDLLQETSRNNQLSQLERRLQEFELESWQRQQKLEDAANDQQRQLAESARQQHDLLKSLTRAVQDTQMRERFAQRPAPAEPAGSGAVPLDAPALAVQPTRPKIYKDEGDDQLTLNLRNDDLREVLEYLSAEGGLNILAMESVQGAVSATLSNVDVFTALQAILKSTGYVARYDGDFVYVGKPEDFAQMDQLSDTIGTRIYRTNYVTAAELETLVTPILTPNVGTVTVSSPAEIDVPSDQTHTGGDSFAGNEVILVRDYERVLAAVDDIVLQIDQSPRQVAIEATILSVALDDSHRRGVDFDFLRSQGTVRLTTNSPLATLAGIDISEGGLHFGFLDSDLGTFIECVETMGDTDVVASPHLLCLNKQRAEILIGDQKGYLSTTQTETATTQTVEFLDVGTQLRIRPYISTDGMIRLEVHPELSTGDVKLIGGFALPEKSTTQVTTNIMCRDGATVVIGGLIRDDVSETLTQVPLIGQIPLVGKAFSKVTESVIRNETIVLITPRIVHDPIECSEGALCNTELARRQAPTDAGGMNPIDRNHYARRYLHLADNAWRANNVHAAMAYLDLALYFDPRCEEARQLQCIIMTRTESALRRGIPSPDYDTSSVPSDIPGPAEMIYEQPTNPVSVALDDDQAPVAQKVDAAPAESARSEQRDDGLADAAPELESQASQADEQPPPTHMRDANLAPRRSTGTNPKKPRLFELPPIGGRFSTGSPSNLGEPPLPHDLRFLDQVP